MHTFICVPADLEIFTQRKKKTNCVGLEFLVEAESVRPRPREQGQGQDLYIVRPSPWKCQRPTALILGTKNPWECM